MDKAKRKAIIAGNWKMNKTASEAAKLVDELIPAVKDASCEVVICTPFTDLVTAVEKTKGTNIHVGAENVHFEKSGAFTGEISADMLVDLGVEYVIVGHSERRQYFAETDQTVNKRALAALNAGLKVIICVGESLEQREEGVTEELVRMQTKIALRDVTAEQMANVVIAYEPIWAIGTGKTATADQAEEVCGRGDHRAVRRQHECQELRGAAEQEGRRWRPDRRRIPEGSGLRRDRQRCFQRLNLDSLNHPSARLRRFQR